MITTETWMDVWFKPYTYLHKSWMQDIDQRLLSATNSSLAWQSSYPYLCQVLRLRADYYELSNEFIKALINDLSNNNFQLLDMASFMVTGTFKLDDIELEQKRFLVQRSRALSLRKRIYEPVQCLSEIDAGLMLVRLLCQAVDNPAWQRIKLFFDKNRVSFIETSVKAIDFSDITRRSVIRACSEIYQLNYGSNNPDEVTLSVDAPAEAIALQSA